MRRLIPLLVLSVSTLAMAVNTSTWVQGTGDDFAHGDMHDTVVDTHADLRLSRATQLLVKDDPRIEIIYSLVHANDGTTLIGAGPTGAILRRSKAGEITQVYLAGAEAMVTSLCLMPDGRLLAGISGRAAKLVQINLQTGEAKDLWAADDLQFVWAIVPRPDGSVVLGTGPTGKLIEVSRDGKSRVVFTSKQPNLMRIMAGQGDDIIVGTEPEALVLRVNTKTGEWFVLYDAAEAEVAGAGRDGEGNVYVAATSAGAAAGRAPKAPGGRPGIGPDIPLHREPPTTPEPPALPNPNPGEPEPIPKAKASQRMSVLEADPEDGDATAPQTQPSKDHPQTAAAGVGADDAEGGSMAVYRITPAGFVTEVLRRPGTVYAMVWTGKSLLLGTGPEGEVVEYRPGDEESTTLWKSDSRQVSAMALMPDQSMLLGLSNPGTLVQMDGGFAAKGTYTSDVQDAAQTARFGKLQLEGTLPARTGVTVATRSGNTGDPDTGGWSNWSEEAAAAEFIQVSSPPARFMQYRLTLTTQEPGSTPTIDQVKVNYTIPNIAPKVTRLWWNRSKGRGMRRNRRHRPHRQRVTRSSGMPRMRMMIGWYTPCITGWDIRGKWVLLKDKLTETNYTWETRKLADGQYQVRITASDDRSNAAGEGKSGSRYSDTLTVDNTPPVIGDLKTAQTGDGQEISLRVVDRTGTVARVEYAVDSSDDWQAVNSSDMLYDSPDETVKFAVSKLAAGPHQVTVRAADSKGNTAYETLIITVQDR